MAHAAREQATSNWPKMTIEMVEPGAVRADEYQRVLKLARVSRMAKSFNPLQFVMPVVGRRSDGSLYAIDGQHRLAAAVVAQVPMVPVLVIEGTKPEIEAWMFARQNERVAVGQSQRLLSEAMSGDKDAAAVIDAIATAGIRPSRSGGATEGFVACASVLKIIYQRHGSAHLERVAKLLVALFGSSGKALASYFFDALNRFCVAYPPDAYDQADLTARVREVGLNQVVGRAQALYHAEHSGPSMGLYIARVLVSIYNERRRQANRLDPDCLRSTERVAQSDLSPNRRGTSSDYRTL